jgi:hypothetical protein
MFDTPTKRLGAKVVNRIEETRRVIFDAHSIAAVAAAAAVSEMPADEHCTETTLRLVATMLDKAASMIDPMTIARLTDAEVES